MQLLINEIKGLNAQVLKENGLLSGLLQRQMKYNRQKQKKRTEVLTTQSKNVQDDNKVSVSGGDDDQSMSMDNDIIIGGKSVSKISENKKHKGQRVNSKPKQRLSQNFKHNSAHSNNKKQSFSYANSESCIHFRAKWEKQPNRCPSCKSLNKSRKSTSNETAITHSNIIKYKHQTNMMKLQKLSQKILPKVSKQWLYKKKSKVFHFQ